MTPVVEAHWTVASLAVMLLLLAVVEKTSASTITPFSGLNTFTFRFRLAYFAVYASSLLLPPATQDSLCDGAGYSFHNRTFTCKIEAASPDAPPLWPFLFSVEQFYRHATGVSHRPSLTSFKAILILC